MANTPKFNTLEELNQLPLVIKTASGRLYYNGKMIKEEELPENYVIAGTGNAWDLLAILPYSDGEKKGIQYAIYHAESWRGLKAADSGHINTVGQIKEALSYRGNYYVGAVSNDGYWKILDDTSGVYSEWRKTKSGDKPQLWGMSLYKIDIRTNTGENQGELSKETQDLLWKAGIKKVHNDGSCDKINSTYDFMYAIKYPKNEAKCKKRLASQKERAKEVSKTINDLNLPDKLFNITETEKSIFITSSVNQKHFGVEIKKSTGDQKVCNQTELYIRTVNDMWDKLLAPCVEFDNSNEYYSSWDAKQRSDEENIEREKSSSIRCYRYTMDILREIQDKWDVLLKVAHLKYILPVMRDVLKPEFLEKLSSFDEKISISEKSHIRESYGSNAKRSLQNARRRLSEHRLAILHLHKVLQVLRPKLYQDLSFEQDVKTNPALWKTIVFRLYSNYIDGANDIPSLNSWSSRRSSPSLEDVYLTTSAFISHAGELKKKTPYEQIGVSKKMYYFFLEQINSRDRSLPYDSDRYYSSDTEYHQHNLAETSNNNLFNWVYGSCWRVPIGWKRTLLGLPFDQWKNLTLLSDQLNNLGISRYYYNILFNPEDKNLEFCSESQILEYLPVFISTAKKMLKYKNIKDSTYGDYLNMVKNLKASRFPEEVRNLQWDLFPDSAELLHTLHVRVNMVYNEYAMKSEQERLKSFDVKYSKFRKQLVDKFAWENDDYVIMIPSKLCDLVQEGNVLNHCVGSYTQVVAEDKEVICFLRRKSEKDIPWITIDLAPKEGKASLSDKFTIRQAHGARNSQLRDIPGAFEVLKQWVKEVRCIDESSLSDTYGARCHL